MASLRGLVARGPAARAAFGVAKRWVHRPSRLVLALLFCKMHFASSLQRGVNIEEAEKWSQKEGVSGFLGFGWLSRPPVPSLWVNTRLCEWLFLETWVSCAVAPTFS